MPDELPSAERWQTISDALDAVLDAAPAERRARLAEVCAGDDDLRREVETFLRADAPAFLDAGAAACAVPLLQTAAEAPSREVPSEEEAISGPLPLDDPAPAPLEAGARLGSYRLTGRLGDGGSSTVYRAERADGEFARTVALKVLRRPVSPGSEQERRFRAERQILASFQHPHVAQVFDGGLTDDGRPYLAMEYVEGRPITDHCDRHGCSVAERLALLEQVARAVQAAHERLVVHRDLKPANVLVTTTDGPDPAPTAKLLDFGIAKLLGALPGEETTPQTRPGGLPMTPAYAAPEQVRGEEITTATDVYALGAVLYELLTGRRPHRAERRDPYALARAVVEDDPPRPSAVAPEERSDALRGDLDAIVMKALRKDPARRYPTVQALLEDVHAHRAGRPVQARRSTWRYRTGKFVRRHRGGVATAAAVVLLVVAFVVAMGKQMQKTARQRDRARAEAEKAEQVSQYLVDLFKKADPHRAQGRDLTAKALLKSGTERLDEMDGQPAAQAELAYVLGQTRRRLGLYDSTRQLFEQSLALRKQRYDDEHPDVAESLSGLALFLRDQGRYARAESLMQEAVAVNRAARGPEHESVAKGLKDLTYLQRKQGRLEAAEASVKEALSIQRARLGEDNMQVAESLFNLAAILRDREQYERAERVQRRSLSLCRRLTDGPHPGTAANLSNLALLLKKQERFAEAEPWRRRALDMQRALYGTPHSEVATSLNNLSRLLQAQGRYEQAEGLLRKALAMKRSLHDEEGHPATAVYLSNLGDLLHDRQRPAAADSAYRAARTMLRELGQEQSPRMAKTLAGYGDLLRDRGTYAKAEQVYRTALSVRRTLHGDEHPAVSDLREALTRLYDAWDKPQPAAARRDSLTAVAK